ARPVRRVSCAWAAPALTTITSSAWPASLILRASSTAISQNGFMAILMLASSTPEESDLTRTLTLASMTRLTGTSIFIELTLVRLLVQGNGDAVPGRGTRTARGRRGVDALQQS